MTCIPSSSAQQVHAAHSVDELDREPRLLHAALISPERVIILLKSKIKCKTKQLLYPKKRLN